MHDGKVYRRRWATEGDREGRGGRGGTSVVIRGWFLMMIVIFNYVMFEHLG